MNTREENVAAAVREEQARDTRLQRRRKHLSWARQWHQGIALCPHCDSDEFDIVDVASDASARYETLTCKTPGCQARWKLEFREFAIAVIQEADQDPDWIEFEDLDREEGAR